MKNIFCPADILLPKDADMTKWAVIACDQFTSDKAYWDRVRKTAGEAPSTINLILPEAELGSPREAEEVAQINRTMDEYLRDGVFAVYPDSYVYVERTLENGSIRKGLIGKLDLEAYDYHPGSTSAIRATEKTVAERIPPRQRVRRDAPIELPHVLLLVDDHKKCLIESVAAKKERLPKLYDWPTRDAPRRTVPMPKIEAMASAIKQSSLLFLFGTCIVSCLISFWMFIILGKPLNKLIGHMKKITNDNFDVPEIRFGRRDDEVGQLSKAFNMMHSTVRSQFKELQSHRTIRFKRTCCCHKTRITETRSLIYRSAK